MDIAERASQILEGYGRLTYGPIAAAFVNAPFGPELRRMAGWTDDEEYLRVFEAFMETAAETYRYDTSLLERRTCEEVLRILWDRMRLPEEGLERAVEDFIRNYIDQTIDRYVSRRELRHPGETYPEAAADDVGNLDLARFLSRLPCTADPETDAFCRSIGIDHGAAQIDACSYLACHTAYPDDGDGTRYSARALWVSGGICKDTMLWIAVVLGVDRDIIRTAAEEFRRTKGPYLPRGEADSCLPFDLILEGYRAKTGE